MNLEKIEVSDAVEGRDYLARASDPDDWFIVTVGSCGRFDADPYTFRPDEIVELYELPQGEQQ